MRWGLAGLALALALLAVVMLGLRRQTWWTTRQTVVISLPWGNGPEKAGRATGLDAQVYGPLAFAVGHGQVVVADTYHHRLLWRSLRGHGPWQSRLLPDSMLENLCYDPHSESFFAADNQSLTLWKLSRGRVSRFLRLSEEPSGTSSLWHLAASPRGPLYLEVVRFGHGVFEVRVLAVSPRGHAIPLTVSLHGIRPLSLRAEVRSGFLPGAVRNLQVAPDGNLYVELPSLATREREIVVYRPNGTLIRTVHVHTRMAIEDTALLGVTPSGNFYLAVNVGRLGERGSVLEVTPSGTIRTRLTLPPTRVLAAVYGTVTPDGTLYLNESSIGHFRVVAIRPVEHRGIVWRL
jgi:hypothetical protein